MTPPSDIENHSIIEQEIVNGLSSSNINFRLQCTKDIRELLDQDPSYEIDEVQTLEIVKKLVEFLKSSDHPQLQLEALCILTSIASGKQTKIVVEAGAIPFLVKLIESDNKGIQEQAVCAVGTVSSKGSEYRDDAIHHGALKPITRIIENSQNVSTTRKTAWALSNLCRGTRPPVDWGILRICLPLLASLLKRSNADILVDTCMALCFLSEWPYGRIKVIIDAGVCGRLVELLAHHNEKVKVSASRALSNIVTNDHSRTSVIFNQDVLNCLARLLNSANDAMQREACWILYKITYDNQCQIQEVINANIFPLLNKIQKSNSTEASLQAGRVFDNVVSRGLPRQIRYLVNLGYISPITRNGAKFAATYWTPLIRILRSRPTKAPDRIQLGQLRQRKAVRRRRRVTILKSPFTPLNQNKGILMDDRTLSTITTSRGRVVTKPARLRL